MVDVPKDVATEGVEIADEHARRRAGYRVQGSAEGMDQSAGVPDSGERVHAGTPLARANLPHARRLGLTGPLARRPRSRPRLIAPKVTMRAAIGPLPAESRGWRRC
jgi:hypothetical protein